MSPQAEVWPIAGATGAVFCVKSVAKAALARIFGIRGPAAVRQKHPPPMLRGVWQVGAHRHAQVPGDPDPSNGEAPGRTVRVLRRKAGHGVRFRGVLQEGTGGVGRVGASGNGPNLGSDDATVPDDVDRRSLCAMSKNRTLKPAASTARPSASISTVATGSRHQTMSQLRWYK